MRVIPMILAMVLTLCGQHGLAEDETARLHEWLDEQYESELQRSPLTLTIHGRKDQYDKVDDLSIEAEKDWLNWLQASAVEMGRRFDYDRLTDQGQISYDFWQFRARSEGSMRPYLHHGYVFEQFHGRHTYPVEFLLNFHVVDTEADMVAYINRVEGFSRGLDQWLVQAKKAAGMGIRPPRFAFEFVLEESRKIISGYPFDDSDSESAIWADGAAKTDSLRQVGLIDDARTEELRAQLRQNLQEKMLPAYQRLIAWQEKDIANSPDEARGVSSLPDGGDYYQQRLRYYTHSDMTADEVHQLGLDEVARIQAEMEQIRKALEFEGSLQAFLQFLRDDSQFYYPDTDEGREAYLAQTRELLAQMSDYLPEYFGLSPRSELEVRRVEPYREQDGAAQFYQVGTADGSRPGVYYLHLSDMSAYSKTDLETTAYHEGSPGHHMQLSIAKELTGIPRFRNNVGYSAYAEGWALYAEYLAKEMGAFSDPYNDFGRLGAEVWRAIRLVVDTGLHARGWSEEQAVRYMLENSAIPEAAVRSEIRRYLVAPGQATSYKAGMLRFQAMRASAEEALGDRFDLRGFHDLVLGGGALPLPILEQQVEQWVADQL